MSVSYAGTQFSGKVLKYDFDRGGWDEIYALPFDSTGFYNVYGIAVYNGRPVVCFAGYEDSTDITVHKGKIYVIGQSASTDILEYDEEQDLWNPIDSVIGTPDTPYGYLTFCLTHGSSYGMVAVEDSLYVANTTALLKFPLRDLDVVISDQKSYPSVD